MTKFEFADVATPKTTTLGSNKNPRKLVGDGAFLAFLGHSLASPPIQFHAEGAPIANAKISPQAPTPKGVEVPYAAESKDVPAVTFPAANLPLTTSLEIADVSSETLPNPPKGDDTAAPLSDVFTRQPDSTILLEKRDGDTTIPPLAKVAPFDTPQSNAGKIVKPVPVGRSSHENAIQLGTDRLSLNDQLTKATHGLTSQPNEAIGQDWIDNAAKSLLPNPQNLENQLQPTFANTWLPKEVSQHTPVAAPPVQTALQIDKISAEQPNAVIPQHAPLSDAGLRKAWPMAADTANMVFATDTDVAKPLQPIFENTIPVTNPDQFALTAAVKDTFAPTLDKNVPQRPEDSTAASQISPPRETPSNAEQPRLIEENGTLISPHLPLDHPQSPFPQKDLQAAQVTGIKGRAALSFQGTDSSRGITSTTGEKPAEHLTTSDNQASQSLSLDPKTIVQGQDVALPLSAPKTHQDAILREKAIQNQGDRFVLKVAAPHQAAMTVRAEPAPVAHNVPQSAFARPTTTAGVKPAEHLTISDDQESQSLSLDPKTIVQSQGNALPPSAPKTHQDAILPEGAIQKQGDRYVPHGVPQALSAQSRTSSSGIPQNNATMLGVPVQTPITSSGFKITTIDPPSSNQTARLKREFAEPNIQEQPTARAALRNDTKAEHAPQGFQTVAVPTLQPSTTPESAKPLSKDFAPEVLRPLTTRDMGADTMLTKPGFSGPTSPLPQAYSISTAPHAPAPISAIPLHIKMLHSADKPSSLELSLSPEELGKLRLFITPDGDKLRIVIQAERPETQELLRRNIESFSADLRQSGFAGTSFSFAGWGNAPPAPPKPERAPQRFHSADETAVKPSQYAAPSNGTGLDLRV